MKVQTSRCGAELRIKLIGDMDEYSAADARRICDKLLDENSSADRVIINLAEVAFMDSTGIGFLIGRYKKAKKWAFRSRWKSPILRQTKFCRSAAYTRSFRGQINQAGKV